MFTGIKKKYNLLDSGDIILLNNKFDGGKVSTTNIKKILKKVSGKKMGIITN